MRVLVARAALVYSTAENQQADGSLANIVRCDGAVQHAAGPSAR
jgi:hypothetical protein